MKKAIIVSSVIIVLIGILAVAGCMFPGGEKMKNNIEDIAQKNGYNLEFLNDKEFYILQDGVKYYYKNGIIKTDFVKFEAEVDSSLDYEIVDNKGYITVFSLGEDKVEVVQEDDCPYTTASGKEAVFRESIRFTCTSEFTEESIDTDSATALVGKGNKEYTKVTKYFISAEELRELYENAMNICDSFN